MWKANVSKNRDKCEMLPLETKQSGGKLGRHSGIGGEGGVPRGNTPQNELQEEIVQTSRGNNTDTRLELGTQRNKRKIGVLEEGDAEERSVCSRCQ